MYQITTETIRKWISGFLQYGLEALEEKPRKGRKKKLSSEAVCPQKDLGVALVMPSVGTLCMQEHLEEISKCIDQEKHGWIVLDRATGHTTKKIKLPHNISLLPLPPASPE